MERPSERGRKQGRDGHPSLHTWIRGYRDTDRLRIWLTLLKPCRHTHTLNVCHNQQYIQYSIFRSGREYLTVVAVNMSPFSTRSICRFEVSTDWELFLCVFRRATFSGPTTAIFFFSRSPSSSRYPAAWQTYSIIIPSEWGSQSNWLPNK